MKNSDLSLHSDTSGYHPEASVSLSNTRDLSSKPDSKKHSCHRESGFLITRIRSCLTEIHLMKVGIGAKTPTLTQPLPSILILQSQQWDDSNQRTSFDEVCEGKRAIVVIIREKNIKKGFNLYCLWASSQVSWEKSRHNFTIFLYSGVFPSGWIIHTPSRSWENTDNWLFFFMKTKHFVVTTMEFIGTENIGAE